MTATRETAARGLPGAAPAAAATPDGALPPSWTRLTAAAAKRLAIALAVVAVGAIAVAGSAILSVWMIPLLAMTLTGVTILVQRPGHAIGWTYLGYAAVSSVAVLLLVPAEAASQVMAIPAWVAWAETTGNVVTTAATAIAVPLSLLLFPDGRAPSRRWHGVTVAAVLAGAVGGTAALLAGGWGGDPAQQITESPLKDVAGGAGMVLSGLFYPVLMLAWMGGAVAFLVRFRRTGGIRRQQLKWLAVAAVYAGVVIAVTTVLLPDSPPGGLADLLIATAFAAPPVGAAVAVLRHGLWDIDVVIRRSVIVAGLVALVTGLYVALVVGVGRLLGAGDADPFLQVVATAVVALVFQPVRERLDRLANRLVYGRRATPYEILTGFSRRVAETQASDDALARIARLLVEGTGAQRAAVWLRVGDRLRLAASMSAEADDADATAEAERSLDAEHLVRLPGDLVVGVEEGGELLGALTMSKSRAEPPTPADEALLRRLAGQAGLLLRNQRLTAELRDRLDELALSRRRILLAGDTARSQLERRLNAATADRLGALEEGVAGITAAARAAGADRTTTLLGKVAGSVAAARVAFADLAGGLFPAELLERGLTAALRGVAERSPTSIACELHDVGRLSPEREVALWYTALEALQNSAKHAEGAPARLSLRRAGDGVELVVSDLGPGFDVRATASGAGVSNMRDRIAAVGGTFDVLSAPGAGSRVVAAVPG